MAAPQDCGESPLLRQGRPNCVRAACPAKGGWAGVSPSVLGDDLTAALLDARCKAAEGRGGEAAALYEDCARLRWLIWSQECGHGDGCGFRPVEALAPERSSAPESSWEPPRPILAFAAQLLRERDQAVLEAGPMQAFAHAPFAPGRTTMPDIGTCACVCEARLDLQEAALAAQSKCRADDEPEVEPERSSRLAAECVQLRLELHSERLEAREAVAKAHTQAPDVERLEEESAGLQALCEQLAGDLSRMHQAHAASVADASDARCKRSAAAEQLREAESALEILGRENARLRAGMAQAGIQFESRFGEARELCLGTPPSHQPNVIPKSPPDSPVGRLRSLPSSIRRSPCAQHDVAVAVYTAAARAGMTVDQRRQPSL